MKVLSQANIYLRASLAFARALVAPMDKVESLCSRGHVMLQSWSQCPRCRLINRFERLERERKGERGRPPRVGLYCLSGANRGQSFLISKERSTLGTSSNADIVLTPDSLATQGLFQLISGDRIRMSSANEQFFKLNGQSQQSATLFDFDEVEILDNRFIVLDLRPRKEGCS